MTPTLLTHRLPVFTCHRSTSSGNLQRGLDNLKSSTKHKLDNPAGQSRKPSDGTRNNELTPPDHLSEVTSKQINDMMWGGGGGSGKTDTETATETNRRKSRRTQAMF